MPKTTGPLQETTLPMTVRVITDGATTTFVELVGESPFGDQSFPLVTGVARCAPGDTFDHWTGVNLAWTRALRALTKTLEEDIPKTDRDPDRLAEARRRVRELKRELADVREYAESISLKYIEATSRTPAEAGAKRRIMLGSRR